MSKPPIALITGAAKRVGKACALALAEAGYDLILTYRSSKTEAEALAIEIEKLGRSCHLLHAEMNDADAPQTLYEQIKTITPSLDLLVNNASVYYPTPIRELNSQHWADLIQVNTIAPIMLTQALLPLLEAADEPQVINFVDTMLMGRPRNGYVAYNASKSALLEATLCLARELAPKIRVNGVAPGIVDWPIGATEDYKQRALKQVLLGKPGTPEDAAKVVKFLACEAPYLTGEIIHVDGGRRLG